MTVLDAYAVLAILKDEPAATPASRLVRDGGRLTAVGIAEVLDHLVRVVGADEESAALDLAELGLLDPVPVDATIGIAAGRLRARRYHRTRCPVSLSDCIAAEAARHLDLALATSDPPLLETCHAEGVAVVALSDSVGKVWSPTNPV